MANWGEEDVSSHEIDPEIIAVIVQAVTQALSSRGRGRRTHCSRPVGVRQEFVHHRIQGFGLSGSSDCNLARRDENSRSENNERMLEFSETQKRFQRQLDLKGEEIVTLKSTIAELKRQLDEETDRRRNADTDNAELREKVENLEADVSRLRVEVKQAREDLQGVLDREEKRVFKD